MKILFFVLALMVAGCSSSSVKSVKSVDHYSIKKWNNSFYSRYRGRVSGRFTTHSYTKYESSDGYYFVLHGTVHDVEVGEMLQADWIKKNDS